MCLPFKLIKFI